jgi:hypothetical protein
MSKRISLQTCELQSYLYYNPNIDLKLPRYDADEQANQTTSAGVAAHPAEQVPTFPPQSQTDEAQDGYGFDHQNVAANDVYQNQYQQQDFQGGSGFDNGAHHEDAAEAEPQGGTGIKEDG